MGIDPMNNISNNNKNTLCSYIISTKIALLNVLHKAIWDNKKDETCGLIGMMIPYFDHLSPLSSLYI
jgi:hypothetical protein